MVTCTRFLAEFHGSVISDQGIHRCSISFKVTKRLKSEYNFTPRDLNQILNL